MDVYRVYRTIRSLSIALGGLQETAAQGSNRCRLAGTQQHGDAQGGGQSISGMQCLFVDTAKVVCWATGGRMGKGHERAAEIYGCFANLPKMVFSAAQGGLGRATTGTLVRCLGARLQGTRGTEGHPESTGFWNLPL